MAVRKRPTSKKKVPARRSPTPRGVDLREKKKPVAKKRRGSGKRAAAAPSPLRRAVDLDPVAHITGLIRDIPDFPKPGILFKDITPLLADPKGFHIVIDSLAERFVGEHVDAIVGIESRGFIFGAALAARLNTSFVPVRKPGKLPYDTDRVAYALEYGEAELEMHVDSLSEGASVLIVDDLLATGGTAAAAAELVERQGGQVSAFAFVIELDALAGRKRLNGVPIVSLLHY